MEAKASGRQKRGEEERKVSRTYLGTKNYVEPTVVHFVRRSYKVAEIVDLCVGILLFPAVCNQGCNLGFLRALDQ